MSGGRPRVVIIGAGFGGIWAARTLARQAVDVTLVDRNNYHTFFPLLYQVAAAELVPTDIAHPVRSLFRRSSNVSVRMAEMTGLDRSRKLVRTNCGDLSYDCLILALGSEPAFFGVDGAEEHAFPLRWMSDAVPLRHHVLTRFEAALSAEPRARARLLTFCVVGGGPTGVEYAGALAELFYGPLLKDFPSIDRDEVQIRLLEGGPTLLSGMPERLSEYAESRLIDRGVRVDLNTRVQAVEPTAVVLDGAVRIETETVVWTAGVQGEPSAASWGLPVGPGGRVRVRPTLEVEGVDDVFVIGDLAYLEDEHGTALPQVAQLAIQQGRHVGRNVLASSRGEEKSDFRFRDPGMLAVIGRNAAVAHIFGGAFRGRLAWFIWLGIHIAWLVGFRNRALVLLNWGWNYVFYSRAVRLILPTLAAPVVSSELDQTPVPVDEPDRKP